MNNTGSFMANAGGTSPALQASIARRQDQPALNQVGQGSPSFASSAQPATPPAAASAIPAGVRSGNGGSTIPMSPNDAESKIIVKALSNRLTQLSKPQAMPAPGPAIPGIGGF